MQAVQSFVRLSPINEVLLSGVTLASTRTFTVDMDGFNTLILDMNLSARTSATAVLVNATGTHPSASASNNYKITSINVISAAGVGTRTAYQDSYAVTGTDTWRVVIPVIGKLITVSISATSGAAGDVLTVHGWKAVSA